MPRNRRTRRTFGGPSSVHRGLLASMDAPSDSENSVVDQPSVTPAAPGDIHPPHLNSGASAIPRDFVEHWVQRSTPHEFSFSEASGFARRRPSHSHTRRRSTSDAYTNFGLRHRGSSGTQAAIDDSENDFGVGIPMDPVFGDNSVFPEDQMLTNDFSDTESLKSKPSTRRSSMDSSIDDVFMPLDDDDSGERAAAGVWPDVAVLDEWAAKERAERESAEAANLVRESVDEAADAHRSGRLRPRYLAPWERPNVLQSQETLRFSYFRDDLPATIHSPTIAGLLQGDQTFKDLFAAPHKHTHMPVPYATAQYATAPYAASQAEGTDPNHAASAANTAQAANAAAHAANAAAHAANTTASQLAQQGQQPGQSQPAQKQQHQKHAANQDSQESQPHAQPQPHIPDAVASRAPSVAPSVESTNALKRPQSPPMLAPWWLDINNPSEEEIRVISRAFGVHPLTAEDISLHETREKVELFSNYYFVCFTSFDIKAWESKPSDSDEKNGQNGQNGDNENDGMGGTEEPLLRNRRNSVSARSHNSSRKFRRRQRVERLKPLAVFSIVFQTGIITVHFRPTPHTINVRRRIRLLRDYLNVTSDWISYALIDDITDGYGPLIAAVDEDVQAIEDAILKMHGSQSDDEDEDTSQGGKSIISSLSGSSSTGYREWREKGDMLRWIGESRKRVMSLLSLLSNKADVIKGFSKRVSEQWSGASRSEIAMYLSDIQDHLVTMTQNLNHYEKLLARSHSNYLAQLNIDMTRTNNEMNDVLSKISVLGTIVLPMNIVTGLWGMNVFVPGQEQPTLVWFWGIVLMMFIFAVSAYFVIMRFV